MGGAYSDGNLVVGVANLGPGFCRTEFTISGMATAGLDGTLYSITGLCIFIFIFEECFLYLQDMVNVDTTYILYFHCPQL